MGDAANGEGYGCMGTELVWELSVPSFEFWCEPQTSLQKIKSYKKINSNPATYSNFLSSADTADFSTGHSLSIRAWYILGKNFILDVLNPK